MAAFDMIIRGGEVIDGCGGARFEADVAIRDGVIAEIGKVSGAGREEIDARGKIVTPGFVDIHTHYDGQATWENTLSPSSGHGVTTVVAGNCGVGFAPCRPGDRDILVEVMEGVEDVPEIVMAEGLPWNWQTFPEYLDALDQRELDIDIAAQLPHSPLRVYVMGERGAKREPATPAELQEMRRLTAEALKAGALGVTTSRMHYHRAKNGELAPSIDSAKEELLALAGGVRDAGRGVFQLITDVHASPSEEFELMRDIAAAARAPVSFTLLQRHGAPDEWKIYLREIERALADGVQIRGQVFPRPVGVMQGLALSLNPFSLRPSYKAIADLPLAEKVRRMRDPGFRQRILAEAPIPDPNPMFTDLTSRVEQMFPLGDPPNYAPSKDQLIGAMAAASGRTPEEIAYDCLLENEGTGVLYLPASNFSQGVLDAPRAMINHPGTILGLGDGGAHYGFICDASYPTTMLSYWARDVDASARMPVERAIELMTSRPASAVGLNDRGVLAAGRKADVNVIDHDKLRLHAPSVRYDLPSKGRRITQRADGYLATIVSGRLTYRNGEATGARAGRLVRGQKSAPARC